MATRLYYRMSQAFAQRATIRLEADDPNGKETQRHLVSALKQLGATGVDNSPNAAQLLARLRELVAARPVLLFVDNAWTAAQLDGLLPTSFHPDSRLIITSRLAYLRVSASYWVRVCVGLLGYCANTQGLLGYCATHSRASTQPVTPPARRPWRPGSWGASSSS